MITKGIRGAITVEANTPEAIREASVELFKELIRKNSLIEKNVSHIIFTVTSDLDAVYPAKFVRSDIGWKNTALMCLPELQIANSAPMCIRVMIIYTCVESFIPKYVYLKGAADLRSI
jgi:chorismate mutase